MVCRPVAVGAPDAGHKAATQWRSGKSANCQDFDSCSVWKCARELPQTTVGEPSLGHPVQHIAVWLSRRLQAPDQRTYTLSLDMPKEAAPALQSRSRGVLGRLVEV